MRRTQLFTCFYTGLMMVILILAGCGKRNDPLPPQIKLPTIGDLGIADGREGISLGWSLAGPHDGIGGFKILRSETNRGTETCPGCPQTYRPFGSVPLGDRRLRREGDEGFRYVDFDVREGSFYSYRIVVCDRAGHCGEPSNEAGLIHASR
jgi:hypothetical protein